MQQAVKLKPNEIPYKVELGVIYNKMAKYEDAVNLLKQVLKTEPDNARAEKELGTAEEGKKRIDYGKKEAKPKSSKK